MVVSLTLILTLAASAAGVGAVAAFLRRPIPRRILLLFALLPILLFPSAFVSDRTPLPLDHTMDIAPWAALEHPRPLNFNLNDIATLFTPWAKAVRMAWKEGSLPLRDRWNGCGTPLAANSQSAAFSPLTLLSFLLPIARAATLLAALKLLIALTGMWLWTRELGVSVRSAIFAAVAFGFSFSFTPWLFFPHTNVLCFWPWILFAIELGRSDPATLRPFAALAALFAVIALAGQPETAAFGCLFAGLWIAGRWISGPRRAATGLVARVALASAIALGLTAFLLVPSLLAIAASSRLEFAHTPFWQPILSWQPHAPVWAGVLTTFFPHTFGNAIGSPMLPGAIGAFPEMTLGYFGIIGWAAALLIFRPGSRRPREEWILLALLVAGFGVAVGQWPLAEIAARIPGLRLVFPLRFGSWIALAGAAIAAFELDRYAKDLRERPRAWLAAALVPAALALLAVLVWVRFRGAHAAAGGLHSQNRRLLLVLGVLGLAAILAIALRKRPKLAIAALTLLCGAELVLQGRSFYRLYPTSLLYPETDLIRFLRSRPGVFRVAGEGPTLFPNSNVFAGMEDIRTQDPLERRDYIGFLDATCGYPYEYFKTLRNLDCSALDFLNVRYVLTLPGREAPGQRWSLAYSGPDGRVFENPRVLPRAFAPERIQFVARRDSGREPVSDARVAFGDAFPAITSNTDWGRTAWVLRDGEALAARGAPAEISEYREATNSASFVARVTGGTAWVVLSLVQDGGWSARDGSGRVLPLLRANGPFLAVALPAGDHRVALRYRPPGFAAGLAISALTVAAVGISLAIAAARRRASRAPTPSG